jgi:type VI secretion system secreted protein VgrG
MQYLPRVGDEVLILFIDNDPDRPIAIGSVHNGHRGTPAFGGVSSLPGDAALTGLRTGEHQGSGANEMVFDDTTGEVGLRLGSTTAGTELNLGHIATPRQDGTASPRGTGAELRTEGAAALRAAQGLLLTTFESAEGSPHLAHAELSELIARCHELTKTLASAVEKAGGHLPSIEASASGQRSLDAWPTAPGAAGEKGTPPAMALASARDVLIATPGSQVLYAGKHVDVAADGALHLASGGHAHVSAGQGVTVHACDGGIDLRAQLGSLRLDAKQGELRADARQSITITSHDGEIVLSGRVIRLVGGDGSYIQLGQGIQVGSPSECRMDVKHVEYDGPRSVAREIKQTATEGARQRAQLVYPDVHAVDVLPAAGWSYAGHHGDDATFQGKTDEEGKTDWVETASITNARIRAEKTLDDGAATAATAATDDTEGDL